ncbi:hypothetical protein HBI69_021000 [Parastagonospora nodorum]|nr:hypothetical protein HBI69_021000 [Parastagonospora nodorum]
MFRHRLVLRELAPTDTVIAPSDICPLFTAHILQPLRVNLRDNLSLESRSRGFSTRIFKIQRDCWAGVEGEYVSSIGGNFYAGLRRSYRQSKRSQSTVISSVGACLSGCIVVPRNIDRIDTGLGCYNTSHYALSTF